jgi:hypothetical protein
MGKTEEYDRKRFHLRFCSPINVSHNNECSYLCRNISIVTNESNKRRMGEWLKKSWRAFNIGNEAQEFRVTALHARSKTEAEEIKP